MSIISRLFGQKESQARIVTTVSSVGRPVETDANYENFAKKGYAKNIVVFAAIQKITGSAKGIRWELYSKGRRQSSEITEHPLLNLINKPNPMQSTPDFIESCLGFYLISGNLYIEKNKPGKEIKELWPVKPDRMRIVPGNKGYPAFYEMTSGGITRRWPVDAITLKSDIAHMKSFNPINEWYGLSPLQAAMLSLDQNNAGQRWNLAMLQNSATPSGVLQMKVSEGNPRGELTDEQYKRLKGELDEKHVGMNNTGRPMLLEGGLSWQSISLGPKEMDFIQNKNVTAIDIAMAYGVPPEILGLGQKTFNNYKEARLSFIEETVLPHMDAFRDLLNRTVTNEFGDNIYLDYDKDDIEALVEKRQARYSTLAAVNFLTQNEKREAAGYGKEDGLDVYVINNEILTKEDIATYNETSDTEPPSDEPTTDEADDESDDSEDELPGGEDQDEAQEAEEEEEKTINLLNKREKRRAWIRQNQKRKFFARSFESDLREDYQELIKDLSATADRMKNADQKLVEYALLKDITDAEPKFARTVGKNIRLILKEFGNEIFGDAKSQGIVVETKANLKYDQYVSKYVQERTGSNIRSILTTNQKQIKRIVSEWVQQSVQDGSTLPELSNYLEMEFEGLSKSSAMRIARTETSMASQNGGLEAVKSLGIPNATKEWVSAQDSRVRDGTPDGADHAAMDGVKVGLDEKFNVPPGDQMDGPGDNSALAENVINCRCVLVFSTGSKQ